MEVDTGADMQHTHTQTDALALMKKSEKMISVQADFGNERNPGYCGAFSALPVNLLKEKCKMTMAKHLQ